MDEQMHFSSPQTMFHGLTDFKCVRLTEVVCPIPRSTVVFEYPTKVMRDDYEATGVIPYITGFENNE